MRSDSRQMLNLKLKMEFSSWYSYRTLGVKVEHSSRSISKTWPALRHRRSLDVSYGMVRMEQGVHQFTISRGKVISMHPFVDGTESL